jgi:proteasome assembly chaperone (PAC2) family protein
MIKKTKLLKLNNPILIAAWPGMGNVALKAAHYLREELNAQEYQQIEPQDFFPIPMISIRNALIESIRLPESKFYFWKNKDGKNDLLIFLSEAQPIVGKEIRFSHLILDVAKHAGVKKIFTFAALSSTIDHRAKPGVWGIATSLGMLKQLQKLNINILHDGHIGGLNGVFLGIAQEAHFEGACLLGEIPFYATQIENPNASWAVLEVFTQLFKLSLDFSKLSTLTRYMEKEIDNYLTQIKEKFSSQELPEQEKDKGPQYIH